MERPLCRLKLADGRLYLEKRDCIESACRTNEEVEDYNHWLIRCPRWELERRHLLAKVEESLPNFASLTDHDDIQSTAIIDLACEDCGIAQLIYL